MAALRDADTNRLKTKSGFVLRSTTVRERLLSKVPSIRIAKPEALIAIRPRQL
jgi:hypothetical protein